MKLSIKEDVNIDELYYLFTDLKKSVNDINEKYKLDNIYNILKYYADNIDITSIYDAVLKNYIIVNISSNINENINEYYFYNYVYVYKNNELYKQIGSIKYKNFIFNPLLNFYFRYIKHVSLTRNYKNIFKIKFNDVLESLNLSYKNINDNSLIINFIDNINRIELIDYNKYNYNLYLEKKMTFIKNNYGGIGNKKHKTNIVNRFNNIHYIINNIKISLRDSHYLYIISKYFNTYDFFKFKQKYNIYKNIEKSLSDKEYNSIKTLYDKEQKHLKLIENNTCEHIKLIDNNEIDTIIKLYIKDKYDSNLLHKHDNWFICKKCDLPLICPHNVFKHLNPKKNLNMFINIENALNPSVYCKICGEFMWHNNIYAKYSKDQNYSYRDLFDLDHTENIDQMIYRIVYNYFLSKNILHAKKNIQHNTILLFVKSHIYSEVESQFSEINKSITTDEFTKTTNKSLILYIYVFCSIVYLTIHNNNILTLFNTKVSHIDKIINNIISDIKISNKHAIKKYNDSQLNRLVYAVYDKLSKYIPENIKLSEIDINFIKNENIYKMAIYNYIFLINGIYFEKKFDVEYILNTSMHDININFNNVYIPTLSFLNKKGGREIEPYLINDKQLTDKIINVFIDFINSDFVFYYLQNNPNYIQLYKNIQHIKRPNVIHNKAFLLNILNEKVDTKNSLRYQINSKLFKYNKLKYYIIKKINNTIDIKYNKITVKSYNKQLSDINNLLNTDLKIINIYDIINIISLELSYSKLDFKINNSDDDFIISNRINLLSNVKYDIDKIIVNGDLYKTLLNIKQNPSLNKYFDFIVKYIKEYDSIHNAQKKVVLGNFISELHPEFLKSADENFEQPYMNIDENNSIEHDFGNENFDYDAEYSDEDVNIKDND